LCRAGTASWTFTIGSLQSAKDSKIYLNVDALVSNRVEAGSGYSASSVRFVARCGDVRQALRVKLVNPFRQSSLALGYS
jgi:hypothetical protein